MRLLVNVNGIYYVHVCEQTRWAHSAGNNVIENLCIIIINPNFNLQHQSMWSLPPLLGHIILFSILLII